MTHPIEKERIYLMAPAACACAVAAISPGASGDELRAAIENAVSHQRILFSRVVINAEGDACLLESDMAPVISLEAFEGEPARLIERQETIPFRTDAGEFVRFFYRADGARTQLVILAHHLVCDGGSLMILARDILLALNRQPIEEKPLKLLTADALPAHPGLNFMMRLMMKQTRRRWMKTGAAFSADDCAQMQARWAGAHANALVIREITGKDFKDLKRLAKYYGVTLNSLLAAAFACVMPAGEGIGIAVDVRPQGVSGMGNFATGISVKNAYNANQTLAENAASLHTHIKQKLNSPKDLFFLYEFMRALSPTLIDAIYFSRFGAYENSVAQATAKMCGYVDAPTGISLSNLKTIEMPCEPAWKYAYDGLYFVPPYMPNVRSVVGISTFQGTLTLALHTEDGPLKQAQFDGLEKACALILRAAREE